MSFSRILAVLCFVSPTLLAGQQKPQDVVRAFFKAEDDGRWLDVGIYSVAIACGEDSLIEKLVAK